MCVCVSLNTESPPEAYWPSHLGLIWGRLRVGCGCESRWVDPNPIIRIWCSTGSDEKRTKPVFWRPIEWSTDAPRAWTWNVTECHTSRTAETPVSYFRGDANWRVGTARPPLRGPRYFSGSLAPPNGPIWWKRQRRPPHLWWRHTRGPTHGVPSSSADRIPRSLQLPLASSSSLLPRNYEQLRFPCYREDLELYSCTLELELIWCMSPHMNKANTIAITITMLLIWYVSFSLLLMPFNGDIEYSARELKVACYCCCFLTSTKHRKQPWEPSLAASGLHPFLLHSSCMSSSSLRRGSPSWEGPLCC